MTIRVELTEDDVLVLKAAGVGDRHGLTYVEFDGNPLDVLREVDMLRHVFHRTTGALVEVRCVLGDVFLAEMCAMRSDSVDLTCVRAGDDGEGVDHVAVQ